MSTVDQPEPAIDLTPIPESVRAALYRSAKLPGEVAVSTPAFCEPPADFWRHLPALDPVPRIQEGYTPLNEQADRLSNVNRIVSCYNEACELVYKRRSWARAKQDVAQSPQYRALCNGCDVMLEKQYPPLGWALWVLRRFYKTRKPSVLNVFGAKFIASHSGWFRKEYDGPTGWTPQPTRANHEQHWRRQDAIRQARGMSPVQALQTTPPWYATLRMEELQLGTVDPLVYYPRILTPKGAR